MCGRNWRANGKVHRRHRQLVNTPFYIYDVLAQSDPHPAVVEQTPRMMEHIEKWYLVRKQMDRKIQEMLGFKKGEVGRN